jgi:hypothetical protein
MANHPIVRPARTHTNEMSVPAGRPVEKRVCKKISERHPGTERERRQTDRQTDRQKRYCRTNYMQPGYTIKRERACLNRPS